MVRAHIIFSGTVQGVGFRYTAQRFARELKINGWVKNLSDGRVELTAEATREQLENLIYKLDKRFETTHKDVDWLDPRNQFTGFEITY